MKILTVLGARPQFIKASVVSKAIAGTPGLEEVIVHTGQHFDANMSAIFFEEMQIPAPQFNLDIHSLSHGAMTGRMLEKIESVILSEKADYVMVYGDTNSTIAGALAAVKLHVPVAHVEAGLRSFNKKMPEEINRILTDRISNLLFCPTSTAVDNLRKEGFDGFDCRILQTGDVMYDAALHFANMARKPEQEMPENFFLATVHRAENTDDEQKLRTIIDAFNRLNREVPVVFPIHPRTRALLVKHKIEPEFQLLDPVGYLEMVWLLDHCRLVLTDSGGLQKEAYFFKKPCVTLRDQTEWVELVEAGVNTLSPIHTGTIIETVNRMLEASVEEELALYGKGDASRQIAESFLT